MTSRNTTTPAPGIAPQTLFRSLVFLALAVPASIAMLAPTSTLTAQSDATHTGVTLSGIITNEATGRTLQGARVEIPALGKSVTTNEEGLYRFFDVPPGPGNLSVSYTGLETQIVPISIAAGSPANRDVGLTAAIYKLSPFVVSGEREGNAQAITLQRLSDGIKNVVSSDAFGTLAGNPADLLVRIPGIVGESVGGDLRYVRIRGMASGLNSITMDGNRVASAAGPAREYEFQLANSDTIERMEVIKSPTPDRDADSIGGVVNMISKSAFDRSPERRIGFSAGLIMHTDAERDYPHRNQSISYSEVFGGKLGIAANYSHRTHMALQEIATQGSQAVLAEDAFTSSLQWSDSRNVRTRWGGGIKVDYKLTESTRIYLTASLNRSLEQNNNHIATVSTTATVATRDAAGNLTGTGGIVPGFTREVTDWRPLTTTIAQINANATHVKGQTFHSTLGAVHRFKEMDIDYDIYKSRNKGWWPRPGVGSFIITARNIGIRIERGDDPFFPRITQTAGPDITNITSYTENSFVPQEMTSIAELQGASVNIKKKFNTPVPTWIKAGVRRREEARDYSATVRGTVYVGPDGVAGANPATGINDDSLAIFRNPNVQSPVAGGRYPKMGFPGTPFRDPSGSTYDYTGFNVNTLLETHPEQFIPSVATNTQSGLTGTQDFGENITGAYIMGNIEIGKLSVLGGFRVEDTKTEGNGALQEITADEKARRAAWVGAVTPAEALRRVLAEYSGRIGVTGEYRKVFPGLHLKYRALPGLIARLSYSTNIGRPAVGNLIPRTTVNNDLRSISSSNPNLLPQYANNFDAGLEYYFEPIGLFSASVFLKEIKDYIFTAGGQTVQPGTDNGFNGDYVGYTLTSPRNAGSARVRGFELNYQQQFTFLPGWLSGFGTFANFTKLETKGDYGTNVVRATSEVAGFTPKTGNVGLSYIRRKVSLRLQYNYTSRWLVSFNANPAALQYKEARPVLDLKTVYTLSRRFDVYLDVQNLLEEPDRAITFGSGRPQTMTRIPPQVYFGFNGRL